MTSDRSLGRILPVFVLSALALTSLLVVALWMWGFPALRERQRLES